MYNFDTFLEKPIREMIQGCVENGIWSELSSIAVHLQNLDRLRSHTQSSQYYEIGPTMSETKYAFWILTSGLVMATIMFGVEILAAKFKF